MGASSQTGGPGSAGAHAGDAHKDRSGIDVLLGSVLFVVFAVLWAGFALALVVSQGSLDAAWEWIGSLPLVGRIVAQVAFLPVVGGLWMRH